VTVEADIDKSGQTPRIVIQTRFPASLIAELSGIPGVHANLGEVNLPLDPRLYELVLRKLDKPTVSPRVTQWYERITEEEAQRISLKQLLDAPLDPAATALWPFQRVAVNFLLRVNRALLCDEPGLGKTATAITAARLTKPNGRILVLCPNSLKYWWDAEIRRWHPEAHILVLRSGRLYRDRDWAAYKRLPSGYLIVNWEALRLLPQVLAQVWQWILADEAHRVKNRDTQVYHALNTVRTGRLVLITATPFANKPAELWTLLHMVAPHRYTSYWRFFEMYTDYSPWDPYRTIRGVKNADLLARELAPIMIRRTKTECLPQLPEKTYTTIRLELEPHQARAYLQMAKEMYVELESGDAIEAVNTLSLLTRLRQLVSTTATLDVTDYSAKLDAVMDLVQDAPDDRFVIFTQFRKTVEALVRRLTEAGISSLWLMGGLGADEVAQRVAAFQSGCGRVFVATTQTGGVGLTLTSAHTLVFIEKHYSPAVQEQAEDRIHRMGQKVAVQIISLLCNDTVDELVEEILARKVEMVNAVLHQALLRNLKKALEIDKVICE